MGEWPGFLFSIFLITVALLGVLMGALLGGGLCEDIHDYYDCMG